MRRAVMLFAVLGLAACAATAPSTPQATAPKTTAAPPPAPVANPPVGATGRNYVIFFQEWSAGLDQPALKTIALAAAAAAKNPAAPVTVTGYADPLGSVQANIYLTETRAQVVTDQLTADGVSPARIHQHAAGKVPYTLTSQESRRVIIAVGS
ncbi:MAG TPA: OmpA family protein [Acetobacteraceae bacterium]|nr:OmpA family protein [Acetobacteraceae bacterium]